MVRYFTDDDECDVSPRTNTTSLETSIVNLLSRTPPAPPPVPPPAPPPAPPVVPDSPNLTYDDDGPQSDFSRTRDVCPPLLSLSVILSALVVGTVHVVMGGYGHLVSP